MSYGEPLDRSRNFRVYDGVNSEPRVIILHEPALPVPAEPKKGMKSAEFKKIFIAVLLLGGVSAMAMSDSVLNGHFGKHNARFVNKDEDTWERVEPGFFAKMFCRGNQRPHWCD